AVAILGADRSPTSLKADDGAALLAGLRSPRRITRTVREHYQRAKHALELAGVDCSEWPIRVARGTHRKHRSPLPARALDIVVSRLRADGHAAAADLAHFPKAQR